LKAAAEDLEECEQGMFRKTMVGVVLAAVIIVAVIFGGWVFRGVLITASLLSMHEMLAGCKTKGYNPVFWPGYLFAALYVVLYYFGGINYVWMLLLICTICIITERVFNRRRTTLDALCSLVTLIYPMIFLVCLLMLSELPSRMNQLAALTAVLACPILADTCAYFVGCAIGKHKLCPDISPNKTIEGAIAGFIGGVAAGAIIYFLQYIYGGSVNIIHYIILGGICGIFAQVGDLFASSIKRWMGIKDFGYLFPGHGGMMDRTDSILLCAPVTYIYFAFFVL
jgi:phosphatidate cytidylyltransferase